MTHTVTAALMALQLALACCACTREHQDAHAGGGSELYAFHSHGRPWRHDMGLWSDFNWSAVTTLCATSFRVAQLKGCYYHEDGPADAAERGHACPADLLNASSRAEWIEALVHNVTRLQLDEINLDMEGNRHGNASTISTRRRAFTALAAELGELRAALIDRVRQPGAAPAPRVSFDLSPVPHFDYSGLAAATDFLVIMAYSAVALDAPLTHATVQLDGETLARGLDNLLHHFSIPPTKLVVAWLLGGVDFTCAVGTRLEARRPCALPAASTATRQMVTHAVAADVLARPGSVRHWDDRTNMAFVSYRENRTGLVRQIWSEDAESLALKTAAVRQRRLRGVGAWTADMLYPDTENRAGAVWRALKTAAVKHDDRGRETPAAKLRCSGAGLELAMGSDSWGLLFSAAGTSDTTIWTVHQLSPGRCVLTTTIGAIYQLQRQIGQTESGAFEIVETFTNLGEETIALWFNNNITSAAEPAGCVQRQWNSHISTAASSCIDVGGQYKLTHSASFGWMKFDNFEYNDPPFNPSVFVPGRAAGLGAVAVPPPHPPIPNPTHSNPTPTTRAIHAPPFYHLILHKLTLPHP